MKFNLKGKNVIITGGGSGIGQAISTTFAAQGANVHILELNADNAENTVNLIKKQGGSATAYNCNVVDQKQVVNVINEITSKQEIHILINNAGIAHVGNIEKTAETKKTGGVIINMASIASSVGIDDRFAYSMSKGAILTMTYSIAKDYIKDGIRCNCISPARIHTPFVDGFIKANYPGQEEEMFKNLSATQPIGRMGKPQEVADLALYLCSDEASFITGTDFPIDGGFIKLNG